jgi:hypothetical protein
MNNPTDEIVSELGYSFSMSVIDLPKFNDFDRSIIKNIHSHTIPEDTEQLFAILMGIIN